MRVDLIQRFSEIYPVFYFFYLNERKQILISFAPIADGGRSVASNADISERGYL